MNGSNTSKHQALSALPSIDRLMLSDLGKDISERCGRDVGIEIARNAVENMRPRLLGKAVSEKLNEEEVFEGVLGEMRSAFERFTRRASGRVINATGVVIHTNLGRAPLSTEAAQAVLRDAAGYCNVEFDTETGKRGKRGEQAERLLTQITGAEGAIVVNNCAAAALLVLAVFGAGKEVIVSRGELIEIGGDFRIPDVLLQSGARLREIGTTNRTKIRDYASALNEATGLIMRVRPSNYRIVGFTEKPTVAKLAELSRDSGIPLFEDAGSGALIDLSQFGLGDEETIGASIEAGADLVSFSGDKLLGGPQCGIVVGRAEMVEQLRKHPLFRALRPGKMVYAALEATLRSYQRGTELSDIPVLRMISSELFEIEVRAKRFVERFGRESGGLTLTVRQGESAIGGGAAPGINPKTALLEITSFSLTADQIEKRLRSHDPPIIARIANDAVLIDLRTVREEEESELENAFRSLADQPFADENSDMNSTKRSTPSIGKAL